MLLAALMLCAGCRTPGGAYTDTPAVPAQFGHTSGALLDAEALTAFLNTPGLDALLRQALEANPGLRQAAARLAQAEAVARAGGADRYPQLSLEGKATRSRTVSTVGAGAGQATTSSQFSLGLAASYELDLWGRIGATERAGWRDAEATAADWRAARVTLVAQMGEAWYGLAAQRELTGLIERQIAAAGENLQLVELRYRSGLGTALSVLQQREQMAATEALAPGILASADVLRHQIAVLAGLPPRAVLPAAPEAMPPAPAPVLDLGLPADLLTHRPDVRAALLRIRAADERVAAAVAARLPSLRMTASAGYAAAALKDLFRNGVWSAAGALAEPLLDGGRKRAETDRTKAVLAERLARGEEALLTAVREVEDALVTEHRQRETTDLLRARLDAATNAHRQALARYTAGLDDYLAALVALGRLQTAERELVAARRQLVLYRIALWRSLGAPGLEDLGATATRAGDPKRGEGEVLHE